MKTLILVLGLIAFAGCGQVPPELTELAASTNTTTTPSNNDDQTPAPTPSATPAPIEALVGTWQYYQAECGGVITWPNAQDGQTAMSIHSNGLMNLETWVTACATTKVTSQYTFVPTETQYTLDRIMMRSYSFAAGATCSSPVFIAPGDVSFNTLHEVYSYQIISTALVFNNGTVCDGNGNVLRTVYHKVSDAPMK